MQVWKCVTQIMQFRHKVQQIPDKNEEDDDDNKNKERKRK